MKTFLLIVFTAIISITSFSYYLSYKIVEDTKAVAEEAYNNELLLKKQRFETMKAEMAEAAIELAEVQNSRAKKIAQYSAIAFSKIEVADAAKKKAGLVSAAKTWVADKYVDSMDAVDVDKVKHQLDKANARLKDLTDDASSKLAEWSEWATDKYEEIK